MEKEVKIIPPEGYEIDRNNSSFEKIVFKKKENTKPRSWEEYRAKVPENKLYKVWGVVEGNELSEAFLAMMKLMSLRQDWIHKWSVDNGMTDDWKPDWKTASKKYVIINDLNNITISRYCFTSKSLSFPTREMAEDFMNYFKDLLEVAKSLV